MTHAAPTINKRDRMKNRGMVVSATINVSAIGTASGEAITPAEFNMRTINHVVPPAKIGQFEVEYNYSSGKIEFYKTGHASVVDVFTDANGGIQASLLTDQASAPAGTAKVHALAIMTSTTPITTAITNPDFARNLTITIAAVGAGVTFVNGGVVVIGTDATGAAQTKTYAINTMAGAVGSGKFRTLVTTDLWTTVTSIATDTVQPANSQFSVGVGTKFYLRAGPLVTPAAGDVKGVRKNTSAVASSTYAVDTTLNALDLGADLADGDDFSISYDAGKAIAASGVNIGSGRYLIYGLEAL